jgi:hypothetical protein
MPRHTWTDQSILEHLEPIVDELGRMPTRADLRAHGLLGLWEAMRRRGGVDSWEARVMGSRRAEAIRERAYYISLVSPEADSVTHWLQAERELGLAA